MTAVSWTKGEGEFCLRAKGHALGSQAGCAYISGILYSLAGYLTNGAAGGFVRIGEMRLNSADASLRFEGDQRAEAAFDMAVIGLKQLEQSFPELIEVKEEKDKGREKRGG